MRRSRENISLMVSGLVVMGVVAFVWNRVFDPHDEQGENGGGGAFRAFVTGGVAKGEIMATEEAMDQWQDWLQQPTKDRRSDRSLVLFRRLFQADPQAALQALLQEPDYGIRRVILLDALKLAEREQIGMILQASSQAVSGDTLKDVYAAGIGRLAREAPETSIEVWTALPPSAAKGMALSALVSEWPVKEAITPLLKVFENLEFPEDQHAFRMGFENRMRQLGELELKRAMETTEHLPLLKSVVEKAMGEAIGASLSAAELLKREGPAANLEDVGWRAAIERTATERPWEVAAAVKTSDDLDSLGPTAMHLVSRLTDTDPQRTARWIEGLPQGITTDRMAYIMMIGWLRENPQAASSYAIATKNARIKQVVALAIATDLRSKGDVEGFEQWRAQITDSKLLEHAEKNTIP
jgi:hypothetical protein